MKLMQSLHDSTQSMCYTSQTIGHSCIFEASFLMVEARKKLVTSVREPTLTSNNKRA